MQGYLIARALPAAELEAMICLLTPRMTSDISEPCGRTPPYSTRTSCLPFVYPNSGASGGRPLGDARAFETADL